MRKFRKIVAAIASSAMLLGTMTAIGGVMAPAAFAQSTSSGTAVVGSGVSFSDVTSATPHAYSIYALDALGIATGNGDGTYTPAAPITRAEFAKEVDVAMGYGSAAASASGNCSAFTDICPGGQSQWYTGYVAVAAAQGLVNGTGNGLFNPNGQVTYAQVLTVEVRMLGFGPAVMGGTWPANYMAEASSLLLTAGVNITSASAAAPRQDVAKLLFNTLTTNIATTTYQNNGVTTVTQCNTNVNNNCISLLKNNNNDTWSSPAPGHMPSDNNIVYAVSTPLGALPTVSAASAAGDATVSVASNAILYGASNLQGLIGTQIGYITDINGHVIFAGVRSTSMQATYLSAAMAGGLVTGATVQANGVTETLNNFAGATLNIPVTNPPNALAVDNVIIPNTPNNGDTVTANVDLKGNIISVIDNSLFNYMGVVTNVNASANTLQFDGVQPSQVNAGNYNPTFQGPATVASNASITLNGQSATLSQLKTNDVVYVNYTVGSEITAIAAYDTSASGTITSSSIDLASATHKLQQVIINGTTYNVDPGAIIEQNNSYNQVPGANTTYNNMSATVYYDQSGSGVAFIDITGSTYPVGFIQVGTNVLPGTVGAATTVECWDSQALPGAGVVGKVVAAATAAAAAGNCANGQPGIVIQGYTSSVSVDANGTVASVPFDPNGWTLEVNGVVTAIPAGGIGVSRGTAIQAQLNSQGQITVADVLQGAQVQNITVSGSSVTGTVNGASKTYNVASDVQVFTSSAEAEPQVAGSLSNVVNNGNIVAYLGGITGSPDNGSGVLVETTGSSSVPVFGVLAGDVTGSSGSYQASIDVNGTTSTYSVTTTNQGITLPYLPQGTVVEVATSGTTSATVVEAAVYGGSVGGAYVGIGVDWGALNGWAYTNNTVGNVLGFNAVGAPMTNGNNTILGSSSDEVAVGAAGQLAATTPAKLNGTGTAVYDNVNQITSTQGDLQLGYGVATITQGLSANINNDVSGSNGYNTANVGTQVEAAFVTSH